MDFWTNDFLKADDIWGSSCPWFFLSCPPTAGLQSLWTCLPMKMNLLAWAELRLIIFCHLLIYLCFVADVGLTLLRSILIFYISWFCFRFDFEQMNCSLVDWTSHRSSVFNLFFILPNLFLQLWARHHFDLIVVIQRKTACDRSSSLDLQWGSTTVFIWQSSVTPAYPNPQSTSTVRHISIQGYERKRKDQAHIIMLELRRENGSWAGNVQGKNFISFYLLFFTHTISHLLYVVCHTLKCPNNMFIFFRGCLFLLT